jgi:hypothetical protein
MTQWHERLFTSRQETLTASGVLLDALGEIRTFLAQTIYLETDLYHHEEERQGIIWTKERDIMPLYKMVTMLDPRFIDAYDVASYQLVVDFHRPAEGFAYLDEGIRNNPDSAQLHYDKAFLLQHEKRWQEALEEGSTALRLYAPDPVKLLQESHADQIPFVNAARVMAQCYGDLGNKAGEIYFRKVILMLQPDDVSSQNRLKTLGAPPVGFTPQEFLQSLQH